MAYELTFDYIPLSGFLYKFDARCKWIAFVLFSALIFKLHLPGMLIISGVLVFLIFLHPKELRRNLLLPKPLAVLFLAIFTMNIITTFSSHNVLSAIFRAYINLWKMVLWVFFAMVMSATTKPSDTIMTINYFLRFLPVRWNHRISMMITLAIRFIPIFFKEFERIKDAYAVRIGSNKNARLFIRYMLFPFTRVVFRYGDIVAVAIIARGYREDHPISFKPLSFSNILTLIVTTAFVIFLFELDRYVIEMWVFKNF